MIYLKVHRLYLSVNIFILLYLKKKKWEYNLYPAITNPILRNCSIRNKFNTNEMNKKHLLQIFFYKLLLRPFSRNNTNPVYPTFYQY